MREISPGSKHHPDDYLPDDLRAPAERVRQAWARRSDAPSPFPWVWFVIVCSIVLILARWW